MKNFNFGPFAFQKLNEYRLNSFPVIDWELSYDNKRLATLTANSGAGQKEVIDIFEDSLIEFRAAAVRKGVGYKVELLDVINGNTVAHFISTEWPEGLSPGMPDDRWHHWIAVGDRIKPVDSPSEFYANRDKLRAPPLHWVAALLPGHTLTLDADTWQAPTAWEIRHVVGEGSFTGISGAKAAALVGVTPQNFRKYIATDSAATRQKISFAMWHLLLHRLGVQKAN